MASLYFCHYLIKYTVLQLHLKQCYNFDKKTLGWKDSWTKRPGTDLVVITPYCLQYISHNVSFKILLLDERIIPQSIFSFIPIMSLLDIVFML